MAGPDWDKLRGQAAQDLRAHEELTGLFPAIRPADDSGHGLTVGWLVPLIVVVRRWQHRRELRTQTRESLFPLAPKMLVGLTPTRLVVWQARRRWSLGTFLGYVSRDRIIHADAPTVGQGWRTLRVHLANETSVTLKVPGRIVDDLAVMLSNPPGSTVL